VSGGDAGGCGGGLVAMRTAQPRVPSTAPSSAAAAAAPVAAAAAPPPLSPATMARDDETNPTSTPRRLSSGAAEAELRTGVGVGRAEGDTDAMTTSMFLPLESGVTRPEARAVHVAELATTMLCICT